jgi:class 3 adenylate cyclase
MIRTPSPPKPTWLDALEARLVHPGASADARLKKMIVLAFLALAFFFFLAHAAFFAAGGAFRTAALDLFGAVVAAALAAVMPRVADPVPLWRVYTALHFVLMFLINHSLGGLQHAQGSLIYVLFFPLVVYAIDGVRAAVFTLVAGIGVYGASVWAAPYAPVDQLPPAWMLTTLSLSNMVGTTAVGLVAVYFYGRQSRFLATQLVEEKEARAQETQALLENMLPRDVAQELASTGSTKPVRHDAVSILFTDFSGFTQASAAMPADMVVSQLNEIFAAFDDICDECGVEKIKTIGDAYMAAAGVPQSCSDHAQRCVRAAREMLQFMQARNASSAFKWGLRVGIHSGPVVSGVVGKRKYAFDVWGDTVNIAARMEASGEAGRVNVSAYTCHLIREDFPCEYRGKIEVKGKGLIDMYFVAAPAGFPLGPSSGS